MPTPSCRCGAPTHPTGQCTHCDRAVQCQSTCPRCVRRDEHCIVCRRDCGTKTSAQLCETAHRKAETQQHA